MQTAGVGTGVERDHVVEERSNGGRLAENGMTLLVQETGRREIGYCGGQLAGTTGSRKTCMRIAAICE